MSRRQFTVIALLATAACGGAIAFLCLFDKPDEQIPFTVDGWHGPLTDSQGFTGTWLKMVNSLLDRYEFGGWGVQEVKSLLGEPDCDQIEQETHVIKYDLRDGLKFLVFELGDQDVVVDYYVHMDD